MVKFSFERSQDLVLPNIGQVDFHDFREYLNFNVLEIALKPLRLVQCLPRTPLLCVLQITNYVNLTTMNAVKVYVCLLEY